MAEKLLAGYGRADITPKEPMPLGGYGGSMHRIFNNIMDPLYATAVCVTGTNGETVFFVTADAVNMPSDLADRAREKVLEKIPVPWGNVFIAATHSHSTPDKYATKHPAIPAYNDYFVDQIAEACFEAYEDRRPATLHHGGKVTAGLNFVRHYRIEDGTVAGSNYGDLTRRIVGHAAEPDHRVRLVQFRREVGKDILLVNFQAHPVCTGGMQFFDVSADYVGVVRSQVEAATGCDFAFFLGASGNVAHRSFWAADKTFGFPGNNEPYGKALAAEVLSGLTKLRPVDGTEVHVGERECVALYDHTEDDKAETAQKIQDYYTKTYDRPGANQMAVEAGMSSVYNAGSIAFRKTLPHDQQFSVYAASVGGVGFVGAPYEMFSHNGYAIRDKSPMAETVIMSCCNGSKGYLASKEAFEHGCYEVDNRSFVKGTAEDIAGKFLEILAELKEKQ